MSDTEDGGFDKEAEREKLREKLEAEEESRRATQHMSELLLKGATMTNRHCDRCGDPIFRQDGQEFCPTCGETVGEPEEGTDPIDVASEPADPDDASTDPASTEPPDAQTSTEPAEPDPQTSGPDETQTGEVSPSTQSAGSRSIDRPSPTSADRRSDDLPGARESLVRTLADLSRRAEASEDVHRTRDFLVAAREAAEAIEALDRAER